MRKATTGFVLLEAVVALAILGVASIALLQVRSQQIRVASQARELLTAQALAEGAQRDRSWLTAFRSPISIPSSSD